jgi:hypothetical protein
VGFGARSAVAVDDVNQFAWREGSHGFAMLGCIGFEGRFQFSPTVTVR